MIIPAPVIVLSPPRSFSSVTAAMLGQHPDLYAFPELNLFLSDTLGDLIEWENEVGSDRGYLIGLERTIAQLLYGKQNEESIESAKAWLVEHRGWSAHAVFRWVMAQVAPMRGIEKSTRTAMARRSCHRLLATLPEAHCIHLSRHPASSIKSLMSKVKQQGSYVSRFFAQIWLSCHLTLFELTESLDERQSLRVRGEDLLLNSEEMLPKILGWLELPADGHQIAQMRHPENWTFAHSLPGVHDGHCDSGFVSSPHLRSVVSFPTIHDLWALDLGKELTHEIVDVSQRLGYCI